MRIKVGRGDYLNGMRVPCKHGFILGHNMPRGIQANREMPRCVPVAAVVSGTKRLAFFKHELQDSTNNLLCAVVCSMQEHDEICEHQSTGICRTGHTWSILVHEHVEEIVISAHCIAF